MAFCPSSYSQQIKHYNQLTAKFRKACHQVILLNNKIVDCQTRYDRAVDRGQRSYRYVLRLELMSVEGVRNSIYEYAGQIGEQIEALQEELIDAGHMEEEYQDEGEMDIQ